MHPLLYIPGLDVAIQSHIVALILASGICQILGFRAAVTVEHLDPRATAKALVILAVAPLLGGHLHFVVANFSHGERALGPLILSPSLHAPGAIVGAGLGFVAVARIVPAWRLADAIAPGAGVGVAVARLGCFLNGCCFGTVCPYAWGVRFPRQHLSYLLQLDQGLLAPEAATPLPVHPLQLYFAITGLVIAFVLYLIRRWKRYDGQIALLFLFLFSSSSAALEPFRIHSDARVYLGSYPQLQVVNAAIAVASAAMLIAAEARARRLGVTGRSR